MASQRSYLLSDLRDELLREFMLASGGHKAEILAKIIDLDEEKLDEEKEKRKN